MSESFNIKRFRMYFIHDLKSARSNYWLSLIVCSLTPFLCYVIYEIPMLIACHGFSDFDITFKMMMVLMSFAIVELSFPSKVYGNLTDKKAGSNWILLPASALEKFISMVLIVCVILPVTMAALVLATDTVFTLILPCYGDYIISSTGKFLSETDFPEGFNPALTFSLSWIVNILIFTLGSIIFKRAKVVKTLLAESAIGIAIMIIVIAIMAIFTHGFDSDLLFNLNIDEENILAWGKAFVYSMSAIFIIAVGSALYIRVKTIKH